MSAVEKTSTLWVKVCGLSTVAAIDAAVAAGVQAVGFVFHEPSPRNLAITAAMTLQAAVPAGVERVAVFLHPGQELIDAVIGDVRPDCLQLDVIDIAALRLPPGQRVLPVVRNDAVTGGQVPAMQRFMFEGARSGAGEKADWTVAARLAQHADLVLAGGLYAANVAAAIDRVRPYGVDVSSGVESSRGVKSPMLIEQFVRAARAAHARLAP